MFNDLYVFNPATTTWLKLAPYGSTPSPRQFLGFTATPDGKLYAFGGSGNNGKLATKRILWSRKALRRQVGWALVSAGHRSRTASAFVEKDMSENRSGICLFG